MARPRKTPADVRTNVISIRLTDAELDLLKSRAMAAGMPYGRYAREAALGSAPRPRSRRKRQIEALLYELNSIATNLSQLETATGDATFGQWAAYVGKELIERLHDRDDLLPLIEKQTPLLNAVGQTINDMAHLANMDSPPSTDAVDKALAALRDTTSPLHAALSDDNKD